MPPSRLLLGTCAILLLAGGLQAQRTIIVDRSGQGHFTDIPAAIQAASDGDILLLRNGTYSSFVIDGKSLTIVGAEPRWLNFVELDNIEIRNLSPSQRVVLSDFQIDSRLGGWIQIDDARGSVIFDRIPVTSRHGVGLPFTMRIRNCASVHYHRALMYNPGGVVPSLPPTIDVQDSRFEIANAAVEVVGSGVDLRGGDAIGALRSTIFITNTTLKGGPGRISGVTAGRGGAGLSLVNSRAIVHGRPSNRIAGGMGAQWITFGGDGGPGVEALQGSHVEFFGVAPTGGAAGSTGALPGQPIHQDGTSTSFLNPNALPPILSIYQITSNWQLMDLRVAGQPGTPALLLASTGNVFLPLPDVIGPWLLEAPMLVAEGTISTAGDWISTFAIPSTVPRLVSFSSQAIVLDGTRIHASNSMPILIR